MIVNNLNLRDQQECHTYNITMLAVGLINPWPTIEGSNKKKHMYFLT